jgi:hypothetical protein
MIAAAGVLAVSAADSAPREVRLVVRNMTYYADGGTEANPAIRLRPGETVRIVVRNDDAGMKHDLVVPDWNAETGLISWSCARRRARGAPSITARRTNRR